MIGPIPKPSQIYVINPDNQLSVLNVSAPTTLVSQVAVTGLEGGAYLLSIDWDVKRDKLIGVDDNFRTYTIATDTGLATKIFEPFGGFNAGDAYQLEVNPVDQVWRIITQLGENGRINGTTGELIQNDTNLTFAAGDPNELETPNIIAHAFDNNRATATTTTLYALDAAADALIKLPDPNTGVCQTVGQLGIDVDLYSSFEIRTTSASQTAYLTNNQPLDVGEFASDLYTVDLTTGATTKIGKLPIGDVVLDMAIRP